MNKYLVDLAQSFMKVDVSFFNWNALQRNRAVYEQIAENNFSTEVIRHFRNLMEEPANRRYYENLKCHFDVQKNGLNPSVRPDIVLHRAADSREQQVFFVEVKLKDNSRRIRDDLGKLKRAISQELDFEHGVFMVVNIPLHTVEQYIINFRRESDPTSGSNAEIDWRRVYLFHAVRSNDSTLANYFISDFSSIQNG